MSDNILNCSQPYLCPVRWEELTPIPDKPFVRHCKGCRHHVYHCNNKAQALYHANQNHCIVTDEKLAAELDLPVREDRLFVGLPAVKLDEQGLQERAEIDSDYLEIPEFLRRQEN